MPRNNLSAVQISVTGTATKLIGYNPNRVGVLVTQFGTTDVFIGNSDVTTASGQLLPGTKGAALSLPFYGDVFAVTSGAVQVVSVLEIFN